MPISSMSYEQKMVRDKTKVERVTIQCGAARLPNVVKIVTRIGVKRPKFSEEQKIEGGPI
jgi:hypothetical protein